jgi:hypothetical protein
MRLLGFLIGRWSLSPSASRGRPEYKPRFLPVWWVVLPSPCWFLCLTRFYCAAEALIPTHWEEECPIQIKLSIGAYWRSGRHTPVTREVITHYLCNPRWVPKKCCRSLLAEIQDTEAIYQEATFIVLTQTHWTHVQRLSPENKEVSPYIPFLASRLQRQ